MKSVNIFNRHLCSQGQKSLALDTAIGMWQLLFAEKQWPLVEHWCQFLQVAYQLLFLFVPMLNLYEKFNLKP